MSNKDHTFDMGGYVSSSIAKTNICDVCGEVCLSGLSEAYVTQKLLDSVAPPPNDHQRETIQKNLEKPLLAQEMWALCPKCYKKR